MNIIVIYPGRFHPFHRGHLASYEYLAKKFGDDSVYIATSDVTAPITSPFKYEDKVKMITKLGIPAGHVVKVKNPYQAREITDSLSAEEKANTALIFAVSEKDMQEGSERFKFGTKKNGEPSYLQPMPENIKQLKPMSEHAYVTVTPTVQFRVQGADADSASQIRNLYLRANDQDRNNIIVDLYGEAFEDIKEIFDQRLGTAERVQEFIYGTPIVDAGTKDLPVREHREKLYGLLKTIKIMENRVRDLHLPLSENLQEAGEPPYLDQARALAYDMVDKMFDRRIQDPGPQLAPLRNQLQRLGYRLRGTGRDIKLVNDRYNYVELVEPLNYLDEGADYIEEKWSQKYKRSINCNNPRGFSQRAHCAGRKKK